MERTRTGRFVRQQATPPRSLATLLSEITEPRLFRLGGWTKDHARILIARYYGSLPALQYFAEIGLLEGDPPPLYQFTAHLVWCCFDARVWAMRHDKEWLADFDVNVDEDQVREALERRTERKHQEYVEERARLRARGVADPEDDEG